MTKTQRAAESTVKGRIATNVAWLYFEQIIRLSVGFTVGLWLARFFGPEGYGLLGFSQALATIFGCIATLGIDSIIVRDLIKTPHRTGNILTAGTLIYILSGIAAYTFLAIAIISLRPNDPFSQLITLIIGARLLFKFGSITTNYFESRTQLKKCVIIQTLIFMVASLAKVYVIAQGSNLQSIAWIILIESALTSASLIAILKKETIPNEKLRLRRGIVFRLLRDGWPLLIASAMTIIYIKTDQIMVASIINNQAAGQFYASTRITEVINYIPIAIIISMNPSLIKGINKNIQPQFLYKIFLFLMLATFLISTLVYLMSNNLVTLLYGDQYFLTSKILQYQIWSVSLTTLGLFFSKWMIAKNQQKTILSITALSVGLNIILNGFFIKAYAEVGAAIATLISMTIANLIIPLCFETGREFFRQLFIRHPRSKI